MAPRTIVKSPSAYDYPLLIRQLLHAPLQRTPDQTITYRDRRLTYRELAARIGRLASGLAGLGVAPGDTVAVMDWDSNRYLECFFAVPMMGAVLQTVNVRLSPDQILYTLNHAKASVALVNAEFLPILEAIAGRLEHTKAFVLLNDGAPVGTAPVPFAAEYEAMLAGASPDFAFQDFDENARATTFYTTGTTGLPKGVYFSHRQLVLHTMAVSSLFGMAPGQGRVHAGDVYMPITPMFHVHAWGFPYVATMSGMRQVYPGRYVPDTLLRLIRDERVTFSHCVPTILQMLLTAPGSAEFDLSRMKMVIGGSALPRGLAKLAMSRGIDVFGGYGMSETCPIVTVSHLDPATLDKAPDDQLERRTRAGRPAPLVELRLVDPDMNDVPKDGNSTGEVVVRAPWLTMGYLDNPDTSAELWRGGWLHTGDIGSVDEDGYLQIGDRIKDVIKTGGEWLSSLEIEDIVSRVPGVREVAVIGVPDARWGERPLALVVADPAAAAAPDAAAIRAAVQAEADQGRVSRYAVPERVEFVEALDRTSVGKLDKKKLRVRFATPA